MGSADGGKFREVAPDSEAEWVLGLPGSDQTPGLFSSPHLAGLGLAPRPWGLRPLYGGS